MLNFLARVQFSIGAAYEDRFVPARMEESHAARGYDFTIEQKSSTGKRISRIAECRSSFA